MKQLKGFILGIAVAFALMSVPAVAESVQKTIDVFVDYVNVTVNGEAKQVKNFLHDGTTYIALRDVSEVLGYNVGWDGETKTASITSPDYNANTVVMTVNGTEISAVKFKKMYDSFVAYNNQSVVKLTEDEIIEQVKKELATQAVVDQKAIEFNVGNKEEIRSEIEAEVSAMDMAYGKEMVDSLIASYYGFNNREDYFDYFVTQRSNYELLGYIEANFPEYKAITAGAEAYYNENKENYKEPSARVKHILINTVNTETGEPLSEGEVKAAEALAKDIASRANIDNFEELLKEYNNDPGQPEDGYFVEKNSNFVKEFEDAALAFTAVGQVSQPVLTSYGYHILIAKEVNEYVPYETFLEEYLGEKFSELNQVTVSGWLESATVVYDEEAIKNCIK